MQNAVEVRLTREFENLRRMAGDGKALAVHMVDLWDCAIGEGAATCDEWTVRVDEGEMPEALRVKSVCIAIRLMMARGELEEAGLAAKMLKEISPQTMTEAESNWIDAVAQTSVANGRSEKSCREHI